MVTQCPVTCLITLDIMLASRTDHGSDIWWTGDQQLFHAGLHCCPGNVIDIIADVIGHVTLLKFFWQIVLCQFLLEAKWLSSDDDVHVCLRTS